ncbi:MAG: glycoside hydrolase family 3 protein [Spirochaetota bacterium]
MKPSSKLPVYFLIVTISLGCSQQKVQFDPAPRALLLSRELHKKERSLEEALVDEKARAIANSMTIEEKCAQVLMIGVDGKKEVHPKTKEIFKRVPAGAVILFGFNISEDINEVFNFAGSLQETALDTGAKIPLFIAVDHEGGTVFRFKKGMTHLPSASSLGLTGNPLLEEKLAEIAGKELRAVGISMNLAPVMEVLSSNNSSFLGTRSFGRDTETVSTMGGAFIEGMQRGGVLATAKHFPGGSSVDPHKSLPEMKATSMEIFNEIILPFKKAIADYQVGAIMLSHIMIPALDPDNPVTVSEKIITGVLRNRLGFNGIVVTDDLKMKALIKDYPPGDSAVKALQAGADLLMITGGQNLVEIHHIICEAVRSGSLQVKRINEAVRRILREKIRYNLWEAVTPELRAARFLQLPELIKEGEGILQKAGFGAH